MEMCRCVDAVVTIKGQPGKDNVSFNCLECGEYISMFKLRKELTEQLCLYLNEIRERTMKPYVKEINYCYFIYNIKED